MDRQRILIAVPHILAYMSAAMFQPMGTGIEVRNREFTPLVTLQFLMLMARHCLGVPLLGFMALGIFLVLWKRPDVSGSVRSWQS